jgi:radical SAM superfamily enzyme YgiQ (UPF0313 family)
MDQQSITKLLMQHNPDIVGLSQWTHNRHATIATAGLIKKVLPDSTVLLGGGHATHQAELILQRHPEVDLIVAGEAEQTLLELLEAQQSGRPLLEIPGLVARKDGIPQRTAPRHPLNELDQLPFPSTWLHEAINVDLSLQTEFISTSRGCPAACSFCASPAFWGRKVRARSASSVEQEIRSLRDNYGLIYLSLRDDTFTADRRRTIQLCQQLIENKTHIFWNCQSRVEAIDRETLEWMRKAGCECVQLGVESGSVRILKLLGKNITPEKVIQAADLVRQSGMQLSVFLITGIPEETETDQQQTMALIKRIQPNDLQVAPLAYYPGTQLFEDAVKNGYIQPDLFEVCRDEAVLAQPDGQKQVNRLLARAARYRSGSNIKNLLRLQQQSGFCAVTAMMAGDSYNAIGNRKAAEAQYLQITTMIPDHPWGWYLLGEFYDQAGQGQKALTCYEQVLQLVPQHAPSAEGVRRLI